MEFPWVRVGYSLELPHIRGAVSVKRSALSLTDDKASDTIRNTNLDKPKEVRKLSKRLVSVDIVCLHGESSPVPGVSGAGISVPNFTVRV